MAVGTEAELDAGDLFLRLCGGDGSRSCCPPVCVWTKWRRAAFCTAIMAVRCREGEVRRCRWGRGAAGSAVFSRTFLIASLARCPSGPLYCLGFGFHRPATFPRGSGTWGRGGAAMGRRRAEERLCKVLGRKGCVCERGGQPCSCVLFLRVLGFCVMWMGACLSEPWCVSQRGPLGWRCGKGARKPTWNVLEPPVLTVLVSEATADGVASKRLSSIEIKSLHWPFSFTFRSPSVTCVRTTVHK